MLKFFVSCCIYSHCSSALMKIRELFWLKTKIHWLYISKTTKKIGDNLKPRWTMRDKHITVSRIVRKYKNGSIVVIIVAQFFFHRYNFYSLRANEWQHTKNRVCQIYEVGCLKWNRYNEVFKTRLSTIQNDCKNFLFNRFII